ncbi:hypothetical protein BLNAU_5830 [Blattamonas nauphoetae]|uniref:Uncharacterized protein n=1 Tax=Blattamonas nauphoetae TaxID=2049346 RepID=A0ABQ9Y6A5_9EUKA|nr:hypothetical protein BLNAU_5830 [Blattamonas nauphoetae]
MVFFSRFGRIDSVRTNPKQNGIFCVRGMVLSGAVEQTAHSPLHSPRQPVHRVALLPRAAPSVVEWILQASFKETVERGKKEGVLDMVVMLKREGMLSQATTLLPTSSEHES